MVNTMRGSQTVALRTPNRVRSLLSLVLIFWLSGATVVAIAGEVEDALLASSVQALDIRGVERALRLGAKVTNVQTGQSVSLIYRAVLKMSLNTSAIDPPLEVQAKQFPPARRMQEVDRIRKQARADAEERALPVLRRLFKEGARHKPSENILSVPVSLGAVKILRLLLDNAADPHARFKGYAPIERAAMDAQTAAYDLLVSFGARPISAIDAAQLRMTRAAQWNDIDGMERALREGANVNRTDSCGTTALVAGLSNLFERDFKSETIDWLVGKKVDVNAEVTVGCDENSGHTALLALLSSPMLGELQMNLDLPTALLAQKLVDNGADLTTQDREGNTPLHFAVRWNLLEVTRILLSKSASQRIENKAGKTPPMLSPSSEMTNLLRRHIQ